MPPKSVRNGLPPSTYETLLFKGHELYEDVKYMSEHDLSEEQWLEIEPLIATSHYRKRTRDVVNAILHRMRTQSRWQDISDRFPLHRTVQRLALE